MLLCQHIINIKIINEIIYIFFQAKPLESDVSFGVPAQLSVEQSRSKCSATTAAGATVLDRAGLEQQ